VPTDELEGSDRELSRADNGFDHIVGESAGLKQVLNQVRIVAPTEAHILIVGETGTGKELIARAIHRISPRRQASFIKVNCAAIPVELLAIELFGHEKGAFPGAVDEKVGRLQLADKGTLLLREFENIPLPLHRQLMRVFEEHKLERLGSTLPLEVNARLIATANRDLAKGLGDASFRRDLYYKLHVFPIHLPALRERKQDIPLLARHFVQEFARKMNKRIDTIPPETMSALTDWNWPGNVRELENFIERSVALSHKSVLNAPVDELRPQG
jgi:formate hydrogenlyase transcriptional activator